MTTLSRAGTFALQCLVFVGLLVSAPVWIVGVIVLVARMDHDIFDV